MLFTCPQCNHKTVNFNQESGEARCLCLAKNLHHSSSWGLEPCKCVHQFNASFSELMAKELELLKSDTLFPVIFLEKLIIILEAFLAHYEWEFDEVRNRLEKLELQQQPCGEDGREVTA